MMVLHIDADRQKFATCNVNCDAVVVRMHKRYCNVRESIQEPLQSRRPCCR